MPPKFPKPQDVGRLRAQHNGQPLPTQPQGYLDPTKLTMRPFRARSEVQNRVLELIDAHTLTFLMGAAGTSKTFLAAYKALEYLATRQVEKVLIARPAVEAGDSIGFLPGSLPDKVGPYVRPVLDALAHFIGEPAVKQLLAQGTLEITSLSFLRGRSLNNTFIVLDEMQNATPAQLKLALTRVGEDAKVVVTLDPSQCDLGPGHASAADDLARFKGQPDIAFHHFELRDIVRSRLVRTILQAYSQPGCDVPGRSPDAYGS